ncbi:MAG: hypothetical protein QOI95_2210 [Acidimicrobiaceae bacterium]
MLCIGLDAGNRKTALDLVARGRMPNLAALLERGSMAEVESPYGTFVGSVWPTFATSRGLSRHGRYCYEQLVAGTYEVHRVPGGTADPFWAGIAAAGRRVAVVDLPHADIVPTVDALQVVDWGRHDPNVGFRTHPEALARSILERYGSQTNDSDRYARHGQLAQLRHDLLDGLGRKTDFLVDLVGSEPWDLFLAVFSESHCAGHQLWSLHDQTHPSFDPDLAAKLGDPVEEILTQQDSAIGQLVEAAGDDVAVFVLLSHGMTSHFDATQFLPRMLAAIEDAHGAPRRLTRVRVWAARGMRRVRRTISRRAHRASFVKSVDGSRRFFAIPNNEAYGAIRLNVVGREPLGRVTPGHDFDTTCAFLEEQLTNWVNADTGTPVVARVVRASDHYPESTSCALPDLLIEWERSEPIDAVEAPGLGRLANTPPLTRTGDHIPGGLLVAAGLGIASGATLPPVCMEDIGPTIGAILDVELWDIDGNVVDTLVPL